MGDIVNLNRFRKQKEREENARQAVINRAKHGASKADRQRQNATRSKLLREVEAHRLDRSGPGGPKGEPPGDGAA